MSRDRDDNPAERQAQADRVIKREKRDKERTTERRKSVPNTKPYAGPERRKEERRRLR